MYDVKCKMSNVKNANTKYFTCFFSIINYQFIFPTFWWLFSQSVSWEKRSILTKISWCVLAKYLNTVIQLSFNGHSIVIQLSFKIEWRWSQMTVPLCGINSANDNRMTANKLFGCGLSTLGRMKKAEKLKAYSLNNLTGR